MPDATKYIIVHESVLASWLKDMGSIGSLAALIFVNHQYGAGNGVVDAAGALLLIAFMYVKGASEFVHSFTKEDLRRWALTEEARQ